jgi:endonuclease/exonuclease/phosphatase family metal-dependent hydrolase
MRVATYNVHRGRGAGGWFRPDRIRDVIAEVRPDLIALQEAQFYLRRGADMLGAEALAQELGLCALPVAERPGHQGWRGNVVLARRDARVLRAPSGLRLGGAEPRGAVMAELDLGAGPFRLIATHLSLGAATRRRQGEILLAAMEGAGLALPTLLMGDLNEWRPGGSVLGVLRPVFGEAPAPPTFPAFRPVLSLDRIMGWPRGLVAAVRVHDTPLARRASDHLPLVAELDPVALRRGPPGPAASDRPPRP